MCASYSWRKYRKVVSIGFGAVFPNPHKAVSETVSASSSKRSSCSSFPRPSVMSVIISSIRSIPSRQGTHLPHDSSWRKFRKYFVTSTIQDPSSITTIPPEPTIEPASARMSKSIGRLNFSTGRHPPDGPPIWTALIIFPSTAPPPISNTTSWMGIPIATSTSPVFLMRPVRARIFVPLLPFVPLEANQDEPFKIIDGMLAQVSTLFTAVGFPSIPFWMGNGGRWRGSPILPSMERMSAVSSPHTNAPAPWTISISNEKPVPRMFSPRIPSARACCNAMRKCLTATGYSLRT